MKYIARIILAFRGWKVANDPPPEIMRCVLLATPHTSNWDYLYALSFGFVLGIRFRVAIKYFWTLFPFSIIVKPLGGIGIRRGNERDKSVSQIDMMADLFKENKELTLVLAPEGTRKFTEKWKTGYYHVAHMAGVPLIPVFLDYKKRELSFGSSIEATDDKVATLSKVMAFYQNKEGTSYNPENFTLDQRFL